MDQQGTASAQSHLGKEGKLPAQPSCTFSLFTLRNKGILRNIEEYPCQTCSAGAHSLITASLQPLELELGVSTSPSPSPGSLRGHRQVPSRTLLGVCTRSTLKRTFFN